MKKLIALVMAMAMMLTMVACGGSDKPADNGDTSKPAASSKTDAESKTEAESNTETETKDGDLKYITDKGTFVVGITDFKPMDYQKDGEWIGYDADLAKLFAKKLGVEVQFQEIDWDFKVQELDNKGIDCVWNGMTLLPDVVDVTSCSNAYMQNAQVVVIKADKAADYASIEDMKDLSFAVEKGSAGDKAVQKLGYATNPVDTQAGALMEVQAGTSDAAVIDLLMAYAMTGEGTSYSELTYTFSLEKEEYGVAFRKDSDVVDVFNAFLVEKYADGTMDQLAETYGLSGTVIEQK